MLFLQCKILARINYKHEQYALQYVLVSLYGNRICHRGSTTRHIVRGGDYVPLLYRGHLDNVWLGVEEEARAEEEQLGTGLD